MKCQEQNKRQTTTKEIKERSAPVPHKCTTLSNDITDIHGGIKNITITSAANPHLLLCGSGYKSGHSSIYGSGFGSKGKKLLYIKK